jgi:HSP20 family molecular chaperone IbpA
MPTEIMAEKVEAKIADGILTLNLPKAESARPKRISISVN